MLITETRELQIDDLLDKMAQSLQLDQTRYKRMVNSYEGVQNWIEQDEVFFKPFKYEVYPHGSVRTGTAIKPLSGDEFDLDVVIHIRYTGIQHTPKEIYDHLNRRLSEHETYKKILTPKNRVIRLDYANDFHMDLLIGVQEEPLDEHKLLVPDRELGTWVSSSPRGYANWFSTRVNLIEEGRLVKAYRAENIPIDDFDRKKPLQRAVQLIKRYRDEFFKDDDTYKTSSIILTTIGGITYQGEESIFEAIDGIVTRLREQIRNIPQRIKILNPVNAEEDFTDKWDTEPDYYYAFQRFIEHLYNQWQRLKEQHGVIDESITLKGLFGETPYNKAVTDQALFLEQLRERGELRQNTASNNLTNQHVDRTVPMQRNTFYGSK